MSRSALYHMEQAARHAKEMQRWIEQHQEFADAALPLWFRADVLWVHYEAMQAIIVERDRRARQRRRS